LSNNQLGEWSPLTCQRLVRSRSTTLSNSLTLSPPFVALFVPEQTRGHLVFFPFTSSYCAVSLALPAPIDAFPTFPGFARFDVVVQPLASPQPPRITSASVGCASELLFKPAGASRTRSLRTPFSVPSSTTSTCCTSLLKVLGALMLKSSRQLSKFFVLYMFHHGGLPGPFVRTGPVNAFSSSYRRLASFLRRSQLLAMSPHVATSADLRSNPPP